MFQQAMAHMRGARAERANAVITMMCAKTHFPQVVGGVAIYAYPTQKVDSDLTKAILQLLIQGLEQGGQSLHLVRKQGYSRY